MSWRTTRLGNANFLAEKERLKSKITNNEQSSGAANTQSESGVIDNHGVVADQGKSFDTIEKSTPTCRQQFGNTA